MHWRQSRDPDNQVPFLCEPYAPTDRNSNPSSFGPMPAVGNWYKMRKAPPRISPCRAPPRELRLGDPGNNQGRRAHPLHEIGQAIRLLAESPEINQNGRVGNQLHAGGSGLRVALTTSSNALKSSSESFGNDCEAFMAAWSVPLGGIIFSMTSEKVSPLFHDASLW